jgi:hypothetical protein
MDYAANKRVSAKDERNYERAPHTPNIMHIFDEVL